MADGVSFDFSEVNRVAADLTEVEHLANRKVVQAVQQAALKTMKKWQQDARRKGGPRTSGYPGSIDYTEHEFGGFGQGVYQADVGPDLARYGGKTGKGGLQPSLGILEESSGGVRGPARHSDKVAEKFAQKDLAKGIDIAVEQSLKEAGF